MNAWELLVCLVCVGASGTLAASEAALFSLSRFQVRQIKERFPSHARRLRQLTGDPSGLLVTILALCELFNLTIATLVTSAVHRAWGDRPPLLQALANVALSVPVILLFCDVSPKAVAARSPPMVALLTVRFTHFAYRLLTPMRFVLSAVLQLVVHTGDALAGSERIPERRIREEELLFMVEEGHREGTIQKAEVELIRSVFEMDDTPVSDVFTPLKEVHCLPEATPIAAALESLEGPGGKRFTRIPLLGRERDRITGILYTKDLIRARLDPTLASHPVSEIGKEPMLVGQGLHLNTVFRKFSEEHTHIAVVTNKAGQALGVITMADILDTLFEELAP